ncbi:antitoxin [Alloalcanivorax gelatiniphagus]|uniref:AbrB/MazE/SpoVT family DNA-binding domain-containing protein n=1 Tax=Alloalcanivorax gelatiniphagus TaxID=1194167 RepID=A0ABY2XR54_9GAMM|nr:AbrB/MazE/SpoVT family DNA-binding domain-containing protein [Alloalcanivorax gelatiniphagus]TMW14248.1 AbrB/MazE/SpoVT family DNA-binding domain-containing protein [Alloalcanivorax gelatiniphagus]|tara:strand:- start:1986 stop:2249 length:264 start_codon:yes stop_codon:yes gene_type:complete
MTDTAKVFMSGRSQAVRLPAEYRFTEKEVFIRRDPVTGDIVLSTRPESWAGFLEVQARTDVPDDFLGPDEREAPDAHRDPLEGIDRG